ncbi:MAG: LuxR C-terminal-related transcriptional regulator [Robiginitomaculum sp.]
MLRLHPVENFIPIVRLQSQLLLSPTTKMTIIETLPGYGKTTLGLDWANRIQKTQKGKIVWITATDDINDFKSDMEIQLSAFLNKDVEYDVKSVIHFFNSSNHPIWLFIDNAHKLSLSIIDDLKIVFGRIKVTSHIVLMKRSIGKSHFSSLLALNDAQIFGNSELAFTHHEIQQVLGCNKSIAKVLFDKFLGWPLAYILLKRQGFGKTMSPSLARTIEPKLFSSYIDEEVIEDIEQGIFEKACDLAVLEELNIADAQIICQLSPYEVDGLISALKPIIHAGKHVGFFNPVVHRALRRKAWEHRPDAMKNLSIRASEYFWQKGELAKALTYAAQSGEVDYVCELIEKAGGLFLWINEGLERIQHVMSFTDDHICRKYPRLLLIKSLLHVKGGDLKQADNYWQKAIATSDNFTKDRDGGDLKALQRESQMMGSLLAGYGCHNLEEQVRSAQPFLQESVVEGWNYAQQGYLHTLMCLHALQMGSFDKVKEQAAAAKTAFETVGSDYGILFLDFHLGGAAYAQGHVQSAQDLYLRTEKRRRQYFPQDEGLRFIRKVFAAEVDCEVGAFLGVKRKLFGLERRLGESEAWFDVYASAIKSHSNLTFLTSGYEDTKEELYNAALKARKKGLKRIARFVDVLRMELAGRAYDEDELERLAIKLDLGSVFDDPQKMKYLMWREYVVMVQAHSRFLCSKGEGREAQKIIGELIEYGNNFGNKICQMYGLALRAEFFGINSPEFISLSQDTGYLLPLALSEKLRISLQNEELFQRIHNRVQDALFVLAPKTNSGFTRREQEIIRLLAQQSASDKEIAVHLDVSIHTVRFHMKNIFRKTNSNDRVSAERKAHDIMRLT